MSGQATGWVLRNGPTDRAMKLVLITIADVANTDGEHAHPGIDAMMRGSCYGRSHVLATVAKLVEQGWLEVEEEGGGRGNSTVYRIPGVAGNGPLAGPKPDPKRSSPERETVQSTALNGPIAEAPTDTLVKVINNKKTTGARDTGGSPQTIAAVDSVDELCATLAARVAVQMDRPPPTVTARWREDMRLLLERGPLGSDKPQPKTAANVAAVIAIVFDQLAEPGRDGFCWANQVRSPKALRDHWWQIRQATRTAATVVHGRGTRIVASRAAALAEQAGEAPSGPRRLPPLFPTNPPGPAIEATSQEIARAI